MYLKKLELSGFKSFAKMTVLEFPSKITAIVGPNGSGKSNIAESFRWVLGEQSMKSLRGKKGEDLIWNGSSQHPRMGKASVALLFDNRNGRIPIEFEEVSISRKIFRDGLNEYFINDSQVRLKDVVELMARIGLGETKHNIIGQGEVDRILMSTPRERREMLEEALGLRVYQLKKEEAERKLEHTENNMKQVEGLIREIAPHLKFLRTQARKAEAREEVERELHEFLRAYLAKEGNDLKTEKENLAARAAPLRRLEKTLTEEIGRLSKEIGRIEESLRLDRRGKTEEEEALEALEAKRREILREIGRLEGRLEVERERDSQPRLRVVDTRYVGEEIRGLIDEIKLILDGEERIEVVRSHLADLVENLEGLLKKIERGTVEEKKDSGENVIMRELERTVRGLREELEHTEKEIERYGESRRKEREEEHNIQLALRELDAALRAKQDEERDTALRIERLRFDEERLRAREEVWKRELREAGLTVEELSPALDGYADMPGEELKKKIERLRLKLEEIGGIDRSVVKEYQDTEERHTFFSKEIEDLKQASVSLKSLAKDLDVEIKSEFKNGFAKIKEEFHNYFRIIFGGGRATLRIMKQESRIKGETDEENAEEVKEEEGIDIEVDLPRKRIKGLAMLSGGERALTSVALLFAITAVNPPPFLVLDETDAALDEANSQRYAAILEELAKRTQLVLITHNRETMKCAGILYGVTMGDDGVSKLLSLKLEEAEEYTSD